MEWGWGSGRKSEALGQRKQTECFAGFPNRHRFGGRVRSDGRAMGSWMLMKRERARENVQMIILQRDDRTDSSEVSEREVSLFR